MLRISIIGASGYTGAELAKLVHRHPQLELAGLFVSKNSLDANKPIDSLHGELSGLVSLPLEPLIEIEQVAERSDAIFLATDHKVSHDLAPQLLKKGCLVFDLSGAFRVNDVNFYTEYYHFEHQHANWLNQAVYGLAEWNQQNIQSAQLIAVAGCYPTASQLAIKPLLKENLIETQQKPIINATSGISGAGRKASLNNSFCEVSLQAYGLFNHRHRPEIETHSGCSVIFSPQVGAYKRGILANITMKLKKSTHHQKIDDAFHQAYQDAKLVRLKSSIPKLKDVQGTPFCDIYWQSLNEDIIVISTIDNLLKGAASNAIQCLNLRFNLPEHTGLI